MKLKRKTYWSLVLKQFLQGTLNKLGVVFVLLMFCIALLAPFLANDKPYFYTNEKGKTYYPVMMDYYKISEAVIANVPTETLRSVAKAINPFQFYHYPELLSMDFKKELGQTYRRYFPPIPYSPTEYNLSNTLMAPGLLHIMGTDEQGRDIAARMIHGAQISLSVGFFAVFIYVMIGIFIGAIAGFFGGWVDILISRFIEIVMCFPTFFLILTVLAFVGPSLFNIMVIIGLTGWTGIARLVRGEFLKLKRQEFVESARCLGYSKMRIIFKHILPNALSPVLVSITFGIASSILIESSLSFLGFGVQPPTPSWGDVLSQSREYLDFAWWLMFFPGVSIFLTVTAFNLIGEGLRDAIDPRT